VKSKGPRVVYTDCTPFQGAAAAPRVGRRTTKPKPEIVHLDGRRWRAAKPTRKPKMKKEQ
jgi:hypothetical protein